MCSFAVLSHVPPLHLSTTRPPICHMAKRPLSAFVTKGDVCVIMAPQPFSEGPSNPLGLGLSITCGQTFEKGKLNHTRARERGEGHFYGPLTCARKLIFGKTFYPSASPVNHIFCQTRKILYRAKREIDEPFCTCRQWRCNGALI